ncbi:histidine kinase [Salinimicrobium gaetbulicola]|uniref:Histidine kinase n=1 Tax=Salinimicrobium gaetbulicola TaxID=999702 RepID=A0ABW3IHT4_9FLAO
MQTLDQNKLKQKRVLKITSLSWPKKLFFAAILTVAIEWIFIYLKFGEIFRPLTWDLGLELLFSYAYFVSLVWIYPHISAFIQSEKVYRLKTKFINVIEGVSVVLATLLLTLATKLLPIWLILLVLNEIYGINAYFDEEAVRRNVVLHAILGLFFYYFVERERIKKQIHAEQLHYAQLQREEFRGQLKNLEDQVNPGFLFRSLETLEELIKKNEQEATNYLNDLSFLYRSFLNQKEQLITLKEEVNVAKAYCGLLKSHYRDRISMQFDISNGFLNYQIPPGSLYFVLDRMISSNAADKSLDIHIETSSGILIIWTTKTGLFSEDALTVIKEKYRILSVESIEVIQTENEFKVHLPLLQIENEVPERK